MWNSVVLDIDCNETINFGPRIERTDPSNVFEIHTLATVSSSKSTEELPSVSTCLRKNVLLLAVDNSLLIFTDEFKDLSLCLQHESLIESVTLTDDGKFALVGEQNGVLHVIYVPKKKHIYKCKLFNQCENEKGSFSSVQFLYHKEKIELTILSSSGQLLVLQVDSGLITAADSEHWDEVNQMLTQGSQQRMDMNIYYPELGAGKLLPLCNKSSTKNLACFSSSWPILGVGLGSDEMELVLQMFPETDIKIKKVELSSDGINIFILDNYLRLHAVSRITFLLFMSWCNEDILDFTSVSVPDVSNDNTCMMVLLVDGKEKGCKQLQLRYFPSFELHYSVVLAENTWLISTHDLDHILFLETQSISNKDPKPTLRLCSVSQAGPDTMFAKLLRKGKYCDAENVAILYGLDIQDVYKAQASKVLDDLSMWKVKPSTIGVNALISHLEKINDSCFVIQCCLQAALSSANDTQVLLQYAKDKALKCALPNKMEWIEKVTVLLHRLEAFLILFPGDDWWPRWFEFSSSSFLKIFVKLLQLSDICKAFSFWNLLQGELFKSSIFQVHDVEKLLQNFPDNVPSAQLIPFLEDVLPHVIYATETLNIFAEWMIQQCQLYEITEKDEWPSNGLKLLQVLPNACKKVSSLVETGGVLVSSELIMDVLQRKDQNKIHEVVSIIDDLKQLEELKLKYNCVITFADFRKEDKVSVIFHLLDYLADSMQLESAVNYFFKKYAEQHQLELNRVFALYIEDILYSYQVNWDGAWEKEALWESRVSAILQYIVDPIHKVQAILKVVANSPLPWSKVIKEIVETQLQTENEMNTDLQNQVKLSHFKSLLLKYNLHPAMDAQVFQPIFAFTFVKHILKHNKPTALEDALQVAETFEYVSELDIYKDYLISLLNNSEVDMFLEKFKVLKSEVKQPLGERILTYIITMLNSVTDILLKHHRAYFLSLTESSISIFNHLQEDLWYFKEEISCINISYCFQKEFNLFIRPCDVKSIEVRWKVFQDFLDVVLQKKTHFQALFMTDDQCLPSPSKLNLIRIATILQLPTEEANGRIAVSLLESEKPEEALQVCREINDNMLMIDPESIHSFVLYLLDHFAVLNEEHSGVLQLICQLCSQLVLTCTVEKLEEIICLSQWARQLSGFVALGNKTLTSASLSQTDCYVNWLFSPIYQEHGLRLCLDNLNSLASTVTHLKGDEKCIQTFYDQCCRVILQLRSCGHESLCLDFLFHVDDLASINDVCESNVHKEVASYQKKIMTELSTSLITHIGYQRKMDFIFALGLLCLQKRDGIQKFLLNLLNLCKNDNKRLKFISRLGIQYGQMFDQPVIVEKCKNLYLSATWMSRLGKINITVKDQQILTPERAHSVLADLFAVADMDVIIDFCKDYHLNKYQALEAYLEALVCGPVTKNWGQFPVSQFEKHLKEINSILSEADKCIKHLRSSSDIRRLLYLHLHEANPYCYEVIEWLLKQIYLIESDVETTQYEEPFDVETHQHILKFLKKYKRLGKPLESEISCWMFRCPENRNMPELSLVRLPYHTLTDNTMDDKTKIINQEVYVSNVKLWLSEASLFQMDPDALIVIAAQNEVTVSLTSLQKRHLENKNAESLSLECKELNTNLLDAVKSLVQQIQNMEMAISCAFWIINRLPDGPNKVAAAEASVKLASYWTSQNPSDLKAKVTFQQFLDLYVKYAVTQELTLFSLLKPEYLALVEKPCDLIIRLLEDSTESGNVVWTRVNDRLAAVKAISIIGNCDLRTIYHSLLETWLLQENSNFSGADEDDATITVALDSFKGFAHFGDHTKMNENIRRSIILLNEIVNEDYFLDEVTSLLMRIENASFAERAQVVRVLSAVVDPVTLQSLVPNFDMDQAWEELPSTIYLARLEALGMPFTCSMFLQCNKVDLVVNILRVHLNNPNALMLCSSLCFQYSIWDCEIWNLILRSMTCLKMVDYIECLLWQLASVPVLWHNSAVVSAWQYLLVNRIQTVQSGDDFKGRMIQIYLTYFGCSCYHQLDSTLISEEFESQNQHLLSVCCLLTNMTPDSPVQLSLKRLLSKHPAEELKKELSAVLISVPIHKKIAFTKVSRFLTEFEP